MQLPGNSVVREFEYRVADYCNSKHALSMCNATIGILGTFLALGLRDQEVITTPLTWPGALSGLMTLNCKIRFCDVEPQRLTLDPEKLEAEITDKTKAVMTADFLGYPARLDRIKSICQKYNLWLIHDAASAFGSCYKGYFSGHFADVTIFSFGEKKAFTTGEGGCIVTDNTELYELLLKYMSHPERQEREMENVHFFALNTSMNPFAAEFGLKTFDHQMANIESKREWAIRKLHEFGLEDPSDEYQPNYHKLLIHPEWKLVFTKRAGAFLDPLPFTRLVYQHDSFSSNGANSPCAVAESAITNYAIYNDLNRNV